MPTIANLAGKQVTVMGLGHFGGGVGAVRWLTKQGATVTVTDQKAAEQLSDGLNAIRDLTEPNGPVRLALGGHRDEDFTQTDLVVASPAVPPTSPYLQRARAAKVPVSTELQLFIERLPAGIKTIGVTGSNGKSTTTALIAHLLNYGVGQPGFPYRRVWLGGNIGISLLEELGNMAKEDIVVLELSSFMLEAFEHNGLQWSPNIAVVTNVSPNHLDRHGTMEAYAHAKMNILRYQTKKDFAIINLDDPRTNRWDRRAKGQVFMFSSLQPIMAALLGNEEEDSSLPLDRVFQDVYRHLHLPGMHNHQNAAAAVRAVHAAGRKPDGSIFEAIRPAAAFANFHGLPHRLELVGEKRDVRFYNDSKATTPEAAILALDSFPEQKAVAIVGGYDKGVNLTPLARKLNETCRTVILIGQVAEKLEKLLADSTPDPEAADADVADDATDQTEPVSKPPVQRAESFEDAVRLAIEAAQPKDVILLSPGCASYGMFNHYEERGDRFRELVQQWLAT